VEIVGFKSFCERTVVTFSGTGTTCIVGPNGCGKSNVVDAISWVLGEQSHKSLRAERMADCIFNGTIKRPPMGLAEVTITMEDPELAEAARFVIEGAAQEEAQAAMLADTARYEAGPNTDEPAPGTQEMMPAEGTEEASAEINAPEESPGFKARRKRKAEKPQVVTRPGEVVVSRRLYRSGQSEYLINGRGARLRDIQEMFMGVGLGPDSYAIIEQGRIGQILATKPMERRAIIEEAAGVTKFKTKKRLSEAKLESSKVNLSRVNDIVVEVEKQLASLKRQAAKARRYSEIRDQMRGIVRQMLAGKGRELDAEAERLAARLGELLATETQHTQSIHEEEGLQDRLTQRIYTMDAELRQNQNVLNHTALEVDRSENRIAFNQTRGAELAGRNQQLETERTAVSAQGLEWEFRNQSQLQAVETARLESITVTSRVESLVTRAALRTQQIAQAEARMEALRRTANEANNNLLQLHGEQKQAEEALLHQSESLHKQEVREAEMLEASLQVRDDAERAAQDWQNALSQLATLQHKAGELQSRIVELREKREKTVKEADSLRETLAGVRARHSALTQVLNDHSYTGEAVQKLFAANERHGGEDFRAVGVLADYAEVQEEHEAALEQYMRDELEYVVVETYDHARAGVTMLQNEVGGRATFFVDSLRNLKLDEYEPIIHFRAEDGVLSRLDKLVEFRDPLGPAAKQFLPRLKAGYLTDGAVSAEKLAREYPQYAFVTPEGTCYQGRMVTGGRPDEAGPLGMKRQLRAMDSEIIQMEERMHVMQAELEAVSGELRNCEKAHEELTTQQREAERNQFATKHRHDQTQSDLARLGLELTSCQSELARIRKEIDVVQQRAERAKLQHETAAASRAEAEAESLRLTGEVAQLRGAIQTEQEELAVAKAELAAMHERLASAEAIARRLQDERSELDRREAALRQQEVSISEETAAMARQTEELTQQLQGLRTEKVRLEVRQKELEQEWDAARTRVAKTEDHLRMARQTLQEVREERGKFEIEKARNDSDRQHLRETCLAEVNAQPEDLIASETAFMTGEELAAAETSYREMKQRIENMGAINMMALEEFNECEQRFAFLTRERDDLLQSIADTQQAIKELDLITKERFEQAFTSINTNFTTAFQTIFGGGTAEMRLTEADSSGDAGIDIVASPPGKKLQNVLLLSGGEKAMTALALLIAIFRFQPSPFCILDEVDAPLDEANVGRFTRLIGDMSANTQFIVVTHNRKTMETGSVLYGVTMQEPGVSKLVSVRWEGDEALSAKQRAATAA
jgi:chromosome segregation protein